MAKAPPSAKRDRIKGFVPALVDYTNDVVYGDLWERKGSVQARPQPRHGRGADRDLSAGATRVASDARNRQRRHQGRDHRGHHASRVLCGLAGRRCRRRSSPTRCSSKTRKPSEEHDGERDMLVGFIGLGTMGGQHGRQPAEGRLQARGARPAPAVGEPSSSTPAPTWAETPRALAEQCDVIFTSLPEPPDVEAVALGPDGLLAGIEAGRGLFRPLDQLAERGEEAARGVRRERRAHARRAGERRARRARPRASSRSGSAASKRRVRQAQAGARRDGRPGRLYRADRHRDRRQAGAQHVGLRDHLRDRRDLCARREGRRRAARAVERGAPGRGRPAPHLRRADRSVPAGQIRSAGLRAQARAQGRRRSPTRSAASSACRCASATSRSPR